jgi:hypothetical protein
MLYTHVFTIAFTLKSVRSQTKYAYRILARTVQPHQSAIGRAQCLSSLSQIATGLIGTARRSSDPRDKGIAAKGQGKDLKR